MNNEYLVSSEWSVKEVVSHMEKYSAKFMIVVDDEKHLLGLFTLGDMRHFFLNNGRLSDNITQAMNKHPFVYHSLQEVNDVMETTAKKIVYPIVNCENVVVDIVSSEINNTVRVINNSLQDIPVVIIAGGKGTRLYPYTKILPKPLIPIGDCTISERIINNFRRYGCNKFNMILNYKANMIKAYFSDVKKDYDLCFEDETKFLGTGGGLYLVKDRIHSTFFVSNCDILINDDLECIYKTHKMQHNIITFVCAMKEITVPYGVVKTDTSGKIIQMTEKPEFSFLTSTGMYVMEPEVLNDLEENQFIHLPQIAQKYIDQGKRVGVFPVSEESWLDMGQFSEMDKMMKKIEE